MNNTQCETQIKPKTTDQAMHVLKFLLEKYQNWINWMVSPYSLKLFSLFFNVFCLCLCLLMLIILVMMTVHGYCTNGFLLINSTISFLPVDRNIREITEQNKL